MPARSAPTGADDSKAEGDRRAGGDDRGGEGVAVQVVPGLAEINPAAWDAAAGRDNPFLSHAFLSALEESGSVSAETGWQPLHLVISDGAGGIAAAMPMYLKGHSYGEYVFDWAWADAYERSGGSYYPKLQVAIPFTPATGPRLLIRDDAERGRLAPLLIRAAEQLAGQAPASSVHVTFPIESDLELFRAAGWMARLGVQYHWHNRDYGSFDDFLGALNSRKRKAIRKERKAVADSAVELVALSGGDIRPEHWDAFWRFYVDTTDRKWGQAYLNRRFFSLLGQRMADRVLLILARADGDWVGGALNLIGRDTLYGRNWGCTEAYKFLHFEACYYRAIDWAIAHGLRVVEAGAQGEHKIQRGYLPTETWSAHWFRARGFGQAIKGYLTAEASQMRLRIAALAEESPYRLEDGQNRE